MSQKPRKQYTAEFKAQAVELMETGKPVAQLAEELCMSTNLLYNWRQSAQRSSGSAVALSGRDDLQVLRR